MVTLMPLSDEPGGPEPLAQNGMQGVIVYWQGPAPVTGTRTTRRRAVALRPVWQAQFVRFEALGEHGRPTSVDDIHRVTRLAYAFAASIHPIPSSAEIYYELRLG